ncbi:hypothetical protein BKN14_04500 [Candidatus Gracilibacteria bacterium HOT-871]|nr:hypothetical protein BKN14_04500 [Candidatus Gracilibacteria bacterium HOT-871]RKW22608.1 MAG: N-glycosylase/DNA lyase [Candidatus Gracilibacteria bacterium]
MYFVYIVKCFDNSLYTGITTDLIRREKQHNGEIPGGAKYTLSRKPVKIIYFEKFENRSLATKREIEIKKLSKKEKLKLISTKMNNLLYEKLKNYDLKDAISFEEQDPQFKALNQFWNQLEKLSGEKEKKVYFYLSLILGNSLVCYQLSGKGEDYWEEFSTYFSDKFDEKNISSQEIINLLSEFLKICKKNKRFVDTKIGRLVKFEPFLEKFSGSEKKYFENMIDLRDSLANTMKQAKDSKTIVFAVKMFSYGARNIFGLKYFPKELFIPIDSRLTTIYEKYKTKENDDIKDFYKDLSEKLEIPMLHLDGIIWTSYSDLVN